MTLNPKKNVRSFQRLHQTQVSDRLAANFAGACAAGSLCSVIPASDYTNRPDVLGYLYLPRRGPADQTWSNPGSDFLAPVGALEYYQFYWLQTLFPGGQPTLLAQWSVLIPAAPLMAVIIATIDTRIHHKQSLKSCTVARHEKYCLSAMDLAGK
jgi:hypothetical protein